MIDLKFVFTYCTLVPASPPPMTAKSGANSPVSHSPRTTVPCGLSAGRLLVFLSQHGRCESLFTWSKPVLAGENQGDRMHWRMPPAS